MLLDISIDLQEADLLIMQSAITLQQESLIRCHDEKARIYKEVPAFAELFKSKDYIKHLSESFYILQCYFEDPPRLRKAPKKHLATIAYVALIWKADLQAKHGQEEVDGLLHKLLSLEENIDSLTNPTNLS